MASIIKCIRGAHGHAQIYSILNSTLLIPNIFVYYSASNKKFISQTTKLLKQTSLKVVLKVNTYVFRLAGRLNTRATAAPHHDEKLFTWNFLFNDKASGGEIKKRRKGEVGDGQMTYLYSRVRHRMAVPWPTYGQIPCGGLQLSGLLQYLSLSLRMNGTIPSPLPCSASDTYILRRLLAAGSEYELSWIFGRSSPSQLSYQFGSFVKLPPFIVPNVVRDVPQVSICILLWATLFINLNRTNIAPLLAASYKTNKFRPIRKNTVICKTQCQLSLSLSLISF